MPELDLIPSAYRRAALRRLWARRGIAGYVSALLAVCGLSLGLLRSAQARSEELEHLRRSLQTGRQVNARLEGLRTREGYLAEELRALSSVRGELSAHELLAIVDRALSPEVWFTRWSFERDHQTMSREHAASRRGAFVPLPDPDDADLGLWVHQRMQIQAGARDHAALSEFVRRLQAQPEIAEVQVTDTRSHQHTSERVVSFDLTVHVGGADAQP